ncbi:hypothetical protein FRB94_013869 [Tulasnella sp. JGI-2019a]|nr:hypothetical protein FRB93_008477 [Tulasnella sp. JGI-2019a]KAG9007922.1 hypothetical protein FRB94_013869 [Tulasnella sp. JGI-2019a]KAG9033413.1 hypothetical protein FRB95_014861 [Tulasnella sp. JGI-2019a]
MSRSGGLQVTTEGDVKMTDSEVGELVQHLPLLRVFKLHRDQNSSIRSTIPPTMTLGAFAIIATACPRIEEISIAANCNLESIPDDLPIVRHKHFANISLYCSPIVGTDKSVVAIYLASLPDVANFSINGYDHDGDIEELWRQVAGLIATIRKVRELDKEELESRGVLNNSEWKKGIFAN